MTGIRVAKVGMILLFTAGALMAVYTLSDFFVPHWSLVPLDLAITALLFFGALRLRRRHARLRDEHQAELERHRSHHPVTPLPPR